jgi:anaerobic magnesium-protoporphyrin IX monomethyl ester cyclase
MLWVKLIEILVQARPKAMLRTAWHPDARLRHGMRWYARVGRRVWFHELLEFAFRERRTKDGPTLEEFWGAPQEREELQLRLPGRAVIGGAAPDAGKALAVGKPSGAALAGDAGPRVGVTRL